MIGEAAHLVHNDAADPHVDLQAAGGVGEHEPVADIKAAAVIGVAAIRPGAAAAAVRGVQPGQGHRNASRAARGAEAARATGPHSERPAKSRPGASVRIVPGAQQRARLTNDSGTLEHPVPCATRSRPDAAHKPPNERAGVVLPASRGDQASRRDIGDARRRDVDLVGPTSGRRHGHRTRQPALRKHGGDERRAARRMADMRRRGSHDREPWGRHARHDALAQERRHTAGTAWTQNRRARQSRLHGEEEACRTSAKTSCTSR